MATEVLATTWFHQGTNSQSFFLKEYSIIKIFPYARSAARNLQIPHTHWYYILVPQFIQINRYHILIPQFIQVDSNTYRITQQSVRFLSDDSVDSNPLNAQPVLRFINLILKPRLNLNNMLESS